MVLKIGNHQWKGLSHRKSFRQAIYRGTTRNQQAGTVPTHHTLIDTDRFNKF